MEWDMKEVAIRIHRTAPGGDLDDMKTEFTSEEFGNTVPAVGDLIVEPGVLSGKSRQDPANRVIYEVTARYFLPGAHGDDLTYVALVVSVRQAHEAERSIACVS